MRPLKVFLGFLVVAVPGFAVPGLSLAQTAPCAVQSLQYQLTCYGPNQVTVARAQFAGRAIVPRAIVRQVTGLALTDVELARRILPKPGHQTIFGLVFGSPLGQPASSTSGQASWVEIDEYPTQFRDLRGVKVWRVAQSNNGSALTTLSWNLQENVPGRRLGLQIGTDGSKRVVRRIGMDILRRSARDAAGARIAPASVTAQLDGLRRDQLRSEYRLERRVYPHRARVLTAACLACVGGLVGPLGRGYRGYRDVTDNNGPRLNRDHLGFWRVL